MAESSIAPEHASLIDDLLLPERPPQFGPVTRRLLLRTGLFLLGTFTLGAMLALGADAPAWRAAGLSLILPGGGFLYLAWPSLFLLTILGMAFAVLLWWGLSAFFLVPLVWGLSVLGSALLAEGPRLWDDPGATWPWAIPVILASTVALAATAMIRSLVLHRRKLAAVPEVNAYLQRAQEPRPVQTALEPGDLDRELLGWIYELALQPPDQFEGFDWGEQFHGGTCLRYQLAFLGESLAAYAANALPNHAPCDPRPTGWRNCSCA